MIFYIVHMSKLFNRNQFFFFFKKKREVPLKSKLFASDDVYMAVKVINTGRIFKNLGLIMCIYYIWKQRVLCLFYFYQNSSFGYRMRRRVSISYWQVTATTLIKYSESSDLAPILKCERAFKKANLASLSHWVYLFIMLCYF